jgi:glucose-6-phosphate 1-dehydrogenase
VINGDATLYARGDWVEHAWEILEPILAAWEMTRPPGFPDYAAGTWGPAATDALIATTGGSWRRP